MHAISLALALACHSTTPPPTDTSGGDSAATTSDDTGACENTERRVFDWECSDLYRDPDALPDCAAATTYSSDGGGDHPKTPPYAETCEQRRVWPEACCMDFSKKTHDGLIYEGMSFLGGRWRRPVVTVRSATDWATLLAENKDYFGAELPEIDFDKQMVVVVQDWENESCSFTVEDHGIVAGPEGYGVLRVQFGDHSGNGDPCAAEMGAMVMYAVEQDLGPPQVCASTMESFD